MVLHVGTRNCPQKDVRTSSAATNYHALQWHRILGPMDMTCEVWEQDSYVLTLCGVGHGIDAQGGEGRKYEMSEDERTTIRGVREIESGKAGERDFLLGLWNGRDDFWNYWGGSMKDQRFQSGQFAHCVQPALKIRPTPVIVVMV